MNSHIGGYITRIRAEIDGSKVLWAKCTSQRNVEVGRGLRPTEFTWGAQEWSIENDTEALLEPTDGDDCIDVLHELTGLSKEEIEHRLEQARSAGVRARFDLA